MDCGIGTLPNTSALSRKALAFCPSSPEKALLKRSMSMASCLLLSIKLFLMVRCTERAPACNYRYNLWHDISREKDRNELRCTHNTYIE